ncbi:helix-turn-helix domain-containing protein [Bacillus sp. CRN 9]|nr:helix-turn-helix domain-containing protein [Bacillus sp. CRN 9]
MLSKLQSYYPNAIAMNIPPTVTEKDYYWFKEELKEPYWVGVPKSELREGQLELLSTLYELVIPDHSSYLSDSVREWYAYLCQHGDLPTINRDKTIRFIQVHINSFDQEIKGVEEAIREFFTQSLAFLWLDKQNGIIIEEKSEISYGEEELYSISITLENDFYLKPYFYIGKFRNKFTTLRELFSLERDLFIQALKHLSKERVYSFEKIFPFLLASNLPDLPSNILKKDILPILREDSELRRTLIVFLEHNSNTSHAAKTLYVHRNTLQYRIDKFSEKTDINLKHFNSAIMVYLTCLLVNLPE